METTKTTNKRLRRMRILKVCILTLAVVVIYILAKIPFLSEYVFARGITRGIGVGNESFDELYPRFLLRMDRRALDRRWNYIVCLSYRITLSKTFCLCGTLSVSYFIDCSLRCTRFWATLFASL